MRAVRLTFARRTLDFWRRTLGFWRYRTLTAGRRKTGHGPVFGGVASRELQLIAALFGGRAKMTTYISPAEKCTSCLLCQHHTEFTLCECSYLAELALGESLRGVEVETPPLPYLSIGLAGLISIGVPPPRKRSFLQFWDSSDVIFCAEPQLLCGNRARKLK